MGQQELFATDESAAREAISIPGLTLWTDYVSPGEEQELIAHVDSEKWETDYRRRIQQYGLGYSSTAGGAPTWVRDFPKWLKPLAERVSRDVLDRFAENCVINEYIPPQGIGPHRDYGDFGPVVGCVSLGSDIVMDFADPERGLRVPVHVPAGSFWAIAGEARSKWTHGIARRLTDMIEGERRARGRRISITFRTAKREGEAGSV